jgi:hypothetical protein
MIIPGDIYSVFFETWNMDTKEVFGVICPGGCVYYQAEGSSEFVQASYRPTFKLPILTGLQDFGLRVPEGPGSQQKL